MYSQRALSQSFCQKLFSCFRAELYFFFLSSLLFIIISLLIVIQVVFHSGPTCEEESYMSHVTNPGLGIQGLVAEGLRSQISPSSQPKGHGTRSPDVWGQLTRSSKSGDSKRVSTVYLGYSNSVGTAQRFQDHLPKPALPQKNVECKNAGAHGAESWRSRGSYP